MQTIGRICLSCIIKIYIFNKIISIQNTHNYIGIPKRFSFIDIARYLVVCFLSELLQQINCLNVAAWCHLQTLGKN